MGLSYDDEELIVRLVHEDVSLEAIAARLGVTVVEVAQVLWDHIRKEDS